MGAKGQDQWPHWRLPAPPGADDEAAAAAVQAAADAGALGGELRGAELVIYLPREKDSAAIEPIRAELARELARLGWPEPDWPLYALPDAPWATAWREGFAALPAGRRLLIRPEWERDRPPPAHWADRLTIWLRPGLGFGTGRHESTRLALVLLEQTPLEGAEVLDFGAGNAILAMAAVRLGAARAVAVDSDPQALPNAAENIALNGLGGRIELIGSDRPPPGPGRFDVIACNVIPSQAVAHLGAMSGLLRGPNSSLIYSGFLADEIAGVEEALRGARLRPLRLESMGEWTACRAGPAPGGD